MAYEEVLARFGNPVKDAAAANLEARRTSHTLVVPISIPGSGTWLCGHSSPPVHCFSRRSLPALGSSCGSGEVKKFPYGDHCPS